MHKAGHHVDSKPKPQNPALVKHRKWLNEQAKEAEEKKAKAEEESKKDAEREAKFQQSMQEIRRDIIEGKTSAAVSSWAASTVKSGLGTTAACTDTQVSSGTPKAELDAIHSDLESLISGALMQAGVAPTAVTPPTTSATAPASKSAARLSSVTGTASPRGQDIEAELRTLVDDALQLSSRPQPAGGNRAGNEGASAAAISSPSKGREPAGRPGTTPPRPASSSGPKSKQKPKPKWALSESQAEEDDMMDAEADDLLAFAEGLDFDRYEHMSEAQLRSALESMLDEVVGPAPGRGAAGPDDSSAAGGGAAAAAGGGGGAAAAGAAGAGGAPKKISQTTMENRIAAALQSGDEAWKSRFVNVMNQLAMKEATKSKSKATKDADDDRRSITSAATSVMTTGSNWQVAEILRKENLNLRNIHSAASIRAMLEKQAGAAASSSS
eukprot:jgi/Mesvir1/21483/Mv03933-RA.1